MEFTPEHYTNLGKWAQPVLPGVFWCYWNKTESVRKAAYGYSFYPLVNLDGNFPVKKDDFQSFERLLNDIIKTKEVASYSGLLEKIGQEYKKHHLDILSSKDKNNFKAYIPNLFATYQEIVGFWTFVLLFGYIADEYIFSSQLASSPDEALSRLREIIPRTWLEEQLQEIKIFAREIDAKHQGITTEEVTEDLFADLPELSQKIDDHVARFRWFGTHHWMGDPYDRQKCIQDIKATIKRGNERDSRDNVWSFSVAPDLTIWGFIGTLTYWRTHCAEVASKVVFESREQLIRCAEHLGATYDQLLYLSAKEILEGLSSGARFSFPKNFKERTQKYGCYIDKKGRENIITGQGLNSLLEAFLVPSAADISEFKGMVANRGEKIVAPVIILISPADFPRFKEGHILVAPETTPDFVPAMKKAKAIITDQGGITSHAAIVSRELGVPCVIGTKIATKVLKDGDFVEVDANKGIVKIVKRAK